MNTPVLDELHFTAPVAIVQWTLSAQRVKSESITVTVFLEKKSNDTLWETVDIRHVLLSSSAEITQSERMIVDQYDEEVMLRFRITTNYTNSPVALTFSVKQLPWMARYEVTLGACVLFIVYAIIISEWVHRTVAALLGAFIALAVYSALEGRPSLPTVISWIDFETCCLLFGMMIMVGLFSQTGFFEWCAVRAFKISKGNTWRLVSFLCIFTAVVSSFLDNVTTIMLVGPVTIRLCSVLEIPPTNVMISLVLFSNIGGTATAIGDPPNMMIISDPNIRTLAKLTFSGFSLHLVPAVLFAALAGWILLRIMVKPTLLRNSSLHKLRELQIWKGTARRLSIFNSHERQLRSKLNEHIQALEEELERHQNAGFDTVNISELEEKHIIHNVPLFVTSCVVLSIVLLMFFIRHAVGVDLGYAWIAIIGAIVHIICSGVKEIEDVLDKVEWATLLFFAGLFVLMKCLDLMGLIDWIGLTVSTVIMTVEDGKYRLALAIFLILWVSAIVSAFLDNIPYTAAMINVVLKIASSSGLPLSPLIWSLALGTCFGK